MVGRDRVHQQTSKPKDQRSKHTVTADRLLQVTNLSQRRVLTASAEQITEEVTSDTAGTTAIEERERFLVVCRGLVVFISHDEDGRGLGSNALMTQL